MQTIIPHLWFDREALEAAQLYISLFPDSHMDWTHDLTDTPSGDA
ncbi:VOC family protein, partial [Streptococcus pyogenes]